MIKFIICDFIEIYGKIKSYYCEKDILVDSFWEERVLNSNYYNIVFQEKIIGYCGIYHKSLITLFHLQKEYSYLSEEVFMKVRKLEEVSEVFVPTGDEILLSLSLDNFSSLEKQAYFTRDLDIQKTSSDINLRLAVPSDNEIIEKYSEDFFDDIDKCLSKESIYIAEKENDLVGFGVIEKGVIRDDLCSIGMFVRKEFRRAGIGTNILIELKGIVKSKGKKAVSGCWYYNHNSLKTQFKSGNSCSSRLLRVKF